jgi:hypothetical protein
LSESDVSVHSNITIPPCSYFWEKDFRQALINT